MVQPQLQSIVQSSSGLPIVVLPRPGAVINELFIALKRTHIKFFIACALGSLAIDVLIEEAIDRFLVTFSGQNIDFVL
jgi:hypothetical protein